MKKPRTQVALGARVHFTTSGRSGQLHVVDGGIDILAQGKERGAGRVRIAGGTDGLKAQAVHIILDPFGKVRNGLRVRVGNIHCDDSPRLMSGIG